jgi:hypothetical protein
MEQLKYQNNYCFFSLASLFLPILFYSSPFL